MDYVCEQCGHDCGLCVSDWGYVAALCDECLKARKSYLKLPVLDRSKPRSEPATPPRAPV